MVSQVDGEDLLQSRGIIMLDGLVKALFGYRMAMENGNTMTGQ